MPRTHLIGFTPSRLLRPSFLTLRPSKARQHTIASPFNSPETQSTHYVCGQTVLMSAESQIHQAQNYADLPPPTNLGSSVPRWRTAEPRNCMSSADSSCLSRIDHQPEGNCICPSQNPTSLNDPSVAHWVPGPLARLHLPARRRSQTPRLVIQPTAYPP